MPTTDPFGQGPVPYPTHGQGPSWTLHRQAERPFLTQGLSGVCETEGLLLPAFIFCLTCSTACQFLLESAVAMPEDATAASPPGSPVALHSPPALRHVVILEPFPTSHHFRLLNAVRRARF
ncbi:hypothetical protein SKAU_G00002690 [Synaphobranchus kaupii]|uniref:Uncharacterized protein n=1 Tax=Synaphobranchus kaupii TaxID=118154 RepID=A0A9Q1G9P7_SYNKA|nr:hypothetical protein SKAU_G00002690 [Synaphobranchus kaupii]